MPAHAVSIDIKERGITWLKRGVEMVLRRPQRIYHPQGRPVLFRQA